MGVSAYRQSQWALRVRRQGRARFFRRADQVEGRSLSRRAHRGCWPTSRPPSATCAEACQHQTHDDGPRHRPVLFSGHGVTLPDQSSFLLPVDFDDKDIRSTGYNKRLLLDELKRFPSKALVVSRCLSIRRRSGGLQGHGPLRHGRPHQRVQKRRPRPGHVCLLAQRPAASAELGALQNGIFTKALLEGLGGAADVNGDKIIDTVELDALSDATGQAAEQGLSRRHYGQAHDQCRIFPSHACNERRPARPTPHARLGHARPRDPAAPSLWRRVAAA
mgnify:CR=1 FL=1